MADHFPSVLEAGIIMFQHILIPTDGSKLSSAAVDKAIAFARDTGAKVTILTVVEPFHVFSTDPEQLASSAADYDRSAKAYASLILADAEGKARQIGVEVATLQITGDSPYEAIIATALERGCDLIAMGSHGRSGVAAIIIGSETLKVLTHSKIPVLVYR